ncbi:DUF3592 domain-containing protein [Myroides injenensis]|uniref:DUF3592 domain-containing protein n=1 Tax=Myroides injenensis TaxID=1183151 RepID=UPI00028A0887|nr:DUF3592 domain-containing protein [Myroides injenensis]
MVRSLEKIYYPLAVFLVVTVLFAVIHSLLYILLFIPVVAFLGLLRVYILNRRLEQFGVEAEGKVLEFRSALELDANIASSRRHSIKKEVLIIEFKTEEGTYVKGQPIEYEIAEVLNEDSGDDEEKFNPVGKTYQLLYDKYKPNRFIFKDHLELNTNLYINLLVLFGIILVFFVVYIYASFNIIDTISNGL